MKVEIKTNDVKMAFEMDRKSVLELIRLAMRRATSAEEAEPAAPVKTRKSVVAEPVMEPVKPVKVEHPEDKIFAPTPVGRVERMFGKRQEWDMPHAGAEPVRSYDDGVPPHLIARDKYKGFMYVRCGFCGKEKDYFTREYTNEYKCSCRMITELRDLLPVHMECACGQTFKYMTNMRGEDFDVTCINCHREIPMKMNWRGTAYVNAVRY